MVDDIETLRRKLHMLLLEGEPMSSGEILKVSQELDKRIAAFYLAEEIENEKIASGY